MGAPPFSDLSLSQKMRAPCQKGLFISLSLSALLLSGCASTSYQDQVFQARDLAFHTGPLDPSWRPIEVQGTRLAFRDDDRDATIAISARCGKDAEDVPLAGLTQHLFLQFTERNILDQHLVLMDRREALRTQLQAKLDGVSKSFLVYVLKKDGCVYDLLLISHPASFEKSAKAFDDFARQFSVIDKAP